MRPSRRSRVAEEGAQQGGRSTWNMTAYEMYPGVSVTIGITASRGLASSSSLSSSCVQTTAQRVSRP